VTGVGISDIGPLRICYNRFSRMIQAFFKQLSCNNLKILVTVRVYKLLKSITNSMELSSSREAASCSATQ
jgi:hypothetical protein